MQEPVPPMPQHPPAAPAPPGRPGRSRTRRLVAVGALLSAAALGTVFSVQATASDGTGTPPAQEHTDPPAKKTKPGAGFKMVMVLKSGDVDKAKQGAADFSACMRENGLKDFPDFKVSAAEDGGVRLELDGTGKQLDLHAHAYKKAYKACAPIMAKAGVPLPDEPVPPGKPGKPGKHEGPMLHEELDDNGLPGTTESA
ncbi:hypothetical protein H9Y04_03840 [Streptomyces sp. TRM66268-LWL]|uniref:Secreted protein n=1 Tax=Streptomyces polyasparticus TaxID=2767826 RepID=A0ABR7S9Z5_9ACTN|nr:hypothetical protein [Streptomyces polyasparticus]MBC9711699.1 hypothetical protein [Streptomyces polyasparticus]